jgi:hypothetical protein
MARRERGLYWVMLTALPEPSIARWTGARWVHLYPDTRTRVRKVVCRVARLCTNWPEREGEG